MSIVVATMDRAERLLDTLQSLSALPERPPLIVVDNASRDGTAARVAEAYPAVEVIALEENHGAAARTAGVERASTPYVAFADDDSGWAPGSLQRAAEVLDAHPRLGLLAASVRVGRSGALDPVSAAMAHSPLPASGDSPGRPVLGFVACGAVVRREAYLEVGGFDPLLWFFGEETALAIDLSRAGWEVAYVDSIVALHEPEGLGRDPFGRRRLAARNELLTAWTRRSATSAVRETGRALRRAARDRAARRGGADALRRLPAALRSRRPPPAWLEHHLRLLETRG